MKRLTESQARWLALAQVEQRNYGAGEYVRLWQLGAPTDRDPVALMNRGLIEKETRRSGYWYRLTAAGMMHDCDGWTFDTSSGAYMQRVPD